TRGPTYGVLHGPACRKRRAARSAAPARAATSALARRCTPGSYTLNKRAQTAHGSSAAFHSFSHRVPRKSRAHIAIGLAAVRGPRWIGHCSGRRRRETVDGRPPAVSATKRGNIVQKQIASLVMAAAVLGSVRVSAQETRFEVSANIGQAFSDGVSGNAIRAADGNVYNHANAKNSARWGFSAAVDATDHVQFGFVFGQQISTLQLS